MNISQLMHFVTVAEVLNMHKAANLLYISQPALSQSLAKLEAELNAQLFHRNKHQLELTKYGEAYYVRVKHILNDLDVAGDELRHMTDIHTGIVDVAYIPTLTHIFVPQFIRDLHEFGYNDYHYHLHSDISANISQGILDHTYDLGFVSRAFENPRLNFIQAFPTELVIIVPAEHPLAAFDELDIHALDGLPFITYQRKSALYQPIMNILRSSGVRLNSVLASPEEDSIADLVAWGFGVSLVSTNLYMADKKVKQIHIKGRKYCRMVHLVYDKDAYHTKPVQNVIDFIREEKIPRWMEENSEHLGDDYHIIL